MNHDNKEAVYTTIPELFYEYDLQVWVENGVVRPCGHPASMRLIKSCCAADLYKGLTIDRANEIAKDGK